jgi:small nuclear ribonucleoprotein (snRNP)-like protein
MVRLVDARCIEGTMVALDVSGHLFLEDAVEQWQNHRRDVGKMIVPLTSVLELGHLGRPATSQGSKP